MKPSIKTTPPGPKAQKILERDKRVITQALPRSYGLVIEKAKGTNIWDPDGNRYLDFNSLVAVMNAGHAHPKIVNAIKKQLTRITHGGFLDFYGELPVQFAEKLLGALPKEHHLRKAFLSNSGTEAIETALKLSRHVTKRKYFLAFTNAFHGRTLGSLSLTNTKVVHRQNFGPYLPVLHAPFANPYRNPFGTEEPHEVARASIDWIEDNIFSKQVSPSEIAAAIIEPVQGEGGYVIPPKRFLQELERLCKQNSILFVADEVQTGCSRTGTFLASEQFDTHPDVVVLAKAVGGGLPLGATVFREDLDLWPKGSHASTFGGNFLSCAAGIAALDVLTNKKLLRNVTRNGEHALKRLEELQEKNNHVGHVRGLGLMLGVEFVEDKKTKKPAKKLSENIVKECFKQGLLVLPAGESTVRIAPPLTISKDDLDAGLDVLEKTVQRIAK